MDVRVRPQRVRTEKLMSPEEQMLSDRGVGEDSWESLGLQEDPTSPSRRSVLGVHWKDWCWNWNSNSLATCCEELTHLKRSWCWEILKAGREGGNRGWNGWMASPTEWSWVWVNSGNWWWTGRSGVLQSMGSQRQSDWTELKFLKLCCITYIYLELQKAQEHSYNEYIYHWNKWPKSKAYEKKKMISKWFNLMQKDFCPLTLASERSSLTSWNIIFW